MMDMSSPAIPDLGRIRQRAWIAGGVALALSLIGALLSPDQFFRSYLVAYLFWVGIALGCLAIAMLHYLAGGRWGAVIRRFVESGSRTLPFMAILFVPLVFGIPSLYAWARPEVVAGDPVLQQKAPYLNVPFFLIRTIGYFVIWAALVYFLNKWSTEQDRSADPELTLALRRLSAPGLGILGLTVTFALIDWVMSLEPRWYSTIYGAMVSMGLILAAFAFVTALVALLADRPPFAGVVSPRLFNDLGSMLLAFVMVWAYLAFSQFMLIWAANLVEEVPWYLRRLRGGWQVVAWLLVLFHFVLPFLLLIVRDVKRNTRLLAGVAILVVVSQLINLFWLIEPAFYQAEFHIHWLDLAAVIGVGGIWIGLFVWGLQGRPLLPVHDVAFMPEAEQEHQHG